MGLYNEGNTCIRVSGICDLDSANGEPLHVGMVVIIVVFSVKMGTEVIA